MKVEIEKIEGKFTLVITPEDVMEEAALESCKKVNECEGIRYKIADIEVIEQNFLSVSDEIPIKRSPFDPFRPIGRPIITTPPGTGNPPPDMLGNTCYNKDQDEIDLFGDDLDDLDHTQEDLDVIDKALTRLKKNI